LVSGQKGVVRKNGRQSRVEKRRCDSAIVYIDRGMCLLMRGEDRKKNSRFVLRFCELGRPPWLAEIASLVVWFEPRHRVVRVGTASLKRLPYTGVPLERSLKIRANGQKYDILL
jgi:hypothetical protein